MAPYTEAVYMCLYILVSCAWKKRVELCRISPSSSSLFSNFPQHVKNKASPDHQPTLITASWRLSALIGSPWTPLPPPFSLQFIPEGKELQLASLPVNPSPPEGVEGLTLMASGVKRLLAVTSQQFTLWQWSATEDVLSPLQMGSVSVTATVEL